MLIQETFIDVGKHAQYGETTPYEPFTEDLGKLYRSLQREYGRCTGHVYIDRGETSVKIGWVFVKRVQYEDCAETYLREVWVTLFDTYEPQPPKREYHTL